MGDEELESVPDDDDRGDHGAGYEVLHEVAKGGMGDILAARDTSLERTVAMKVLRTDGFDSRTARDRFAREATILAQLEHPNIVPIHERGIDRQGRPFYTMKMVKGQTLQDILNRIKSGSIRAVQRFPLDRLLTIFRKICDAVAFAHSRGVVHRDLKPENIMVGEFGEVLVMDWGIAKLMDEPEQEFDTAVLPSKTVNLSSAPEPDSTTPARDPRVGLKISESSLTMDGSVLGTPQYMSPEQAEGRTEFINERSDIFSLGAILYIILTLRPPVKGRTVEDVLEKVRSGDIKPPTTYNPAPLRKEGGASVAEDSATRFDLGGSLPHCPGGRIPTSLSAVTMRALALDPAARYASVAELEADIGAYQGGFATSAQEIGALGQIWLLIKRHQIVSGLLAVMFLLSIGFVLRVMASERRAQANESLAVAESRNAVKAQRQTEAVAEDLREALARSHVAEGWSKFEQGDSFGALPAFVRAYELEKDDPERRLVHELRLDSLLRECPRLMSCMRVGEELTAADFYVSSSRPPLVATATKVAAGRFVARVWDLNAGLPVTPEFAHTAVINSVAFDTSGERLVTASDDKTAQVWDLKKGLAASRPLVSGEPVWQARFTPDGEQVITMDNPRRSRRGGALTPRAGNRFGTVACWDASTGEKRWENKARNRQQSDLRVSPDGGRVMVGAFQFVGSLLNAKNGRSMGAIPEMFWITQTQFSRDGERLLVGGKWGHHGAVAGLRLFDVNTMDPVSPLMDSDGRIEMIAFSRDEKWAASAGSHSVVQVWDVEAGRLAFPPLKCGANVSSIIFSPDNRFLVIGCVNGIVQLWTLGAGTKHGPDLYHVGAIRRLEFSPDGDRLYSVSSVGTVEQWDLGSGSVPHDSFYIPGFPTATMTGLSPDERRLGSLNSDFFQMWDLESGRLSLLEKLPSEIARSAVLLGFSARRNLIFALSPGGEIQSYNRLTNELQPGEELEPEDQLRHRGVHFAPDGRSMVVQSGRRLWFVDQDSDQKPRQYEMRGRSSNVSWTGQNGRVAMISGSDAIQVLDVAGGGLISEFKITALAPEGIRFLPGALRIAVWTTAGKVRLLDVATGEQVGREINHPAVSAVRTGPKGRRVLTASSDGVARVWDASTGLPISPWLRHRGDIEEIEFVAEGEIFMTGGRDGTLRCWDSETVEPVTSALGSASGIISMQATADDHFILTSCQNRWHQMWPLLSSSGARGIARWNEISRLYANREGSASERSQLWAQLAACHPDDFQASSREYSARRELECLSHFERENWNRAAAVIQPLVERAPGNWIHHYLYGRALTLSVVEGDPEARRISWKRADNELSRALDLATVQLPEMDPVARLIRSLRFQLRHCFRDFKGAARDFAAVHQIAAMPEEDEKGLVDLSTWHSSREPVDKNSAADNLDELWSEKLIYAPVDGVPFWAQALVHLRGREPEQQFQLRERIDGIPIGRRCNRVHFLHGAAHVGEKRELVGSFDVRYRDGRLEHVPIITGTDVGAWHFEPKNGQKPVNRKLGWIGANRYSARRGLKVRLFRKTWVNPRPEVEIDSIDFVSAMNGPAPFLAAITTD